MKGFQRFLGKLLIAIDKKTDHIGLNLSSLSRSSKLSLTLTIYSLLITLIVAMPELSKSLQKSVFITIHTIQEFKRHIANSEVAYFEWDEHKITFYDKQSNLVYTTRIDSPIVIDRARLLDIDKDNKYDHAYIITHSELYEVSRFIYYKIGNNIVPIDSLILSNQLFLDSYTPLSFGYIDDKVVKTDDGVECVLLTADRKFFPSRIIGIGLNDTINIIYDYLHDGKLNKLYVLPVKDNLDQHRIVATGYSNTAAYLMDNNYIGINGTYVNFIPVQKENASIGLIKLCDYRIRRDVYRVIFPPYSEQQKDKLLELGVNTTNNIYYRNNSMLSDSLLVYSCKFGDTEYIINPDKTPSTKDAVRIVDIGPVNYDIKQKYISLFQDSTFWPVVVNSSPETDRLDVQHIRQKEYLESINSDILLYNIKRGDE